MISKISFKKFKTTKKVLYKMFINLKKVDLGQELVLKSSLSMIANINKLFHLLFLLYK
jgi:hypothetical protein